MAQATIATKKSNGRRATGGVRSLLLMLVLPAVIFTAVFVYTLHERSVSDSESHQGALVWSHGGVIFANTNEIAAWVKQHGGDFETFKRNHPAAVRLVSGKENGSGTAEAATPGAVDPALLASVGSSSPGHRIGLIVLGMVAALLLILALSPRTLLFRLHVAHPANAGQVRLAVGATAAAIAVGLAVALVV